MANQIKDIKDIKELLFKKNLGTMYSFIVDEYKTKIYDNVLKILSQNKVQKNQAIKSTMSSTLGSKMSSAKKKCQKDNDQEKKIQQIVTRLLSYPFTELYVNNDNLDKIKYKKVLNNDDIVAVVHSDSVDKNSQCRNNSFDIGTITEKSSNFTGTKYEISILDGINLRDITNQGEKSIISLTIDSNNLDDNVVAKTDDQKKQKSIDFFKDDANKGKLDTILNDTDHNYDKIISGLKGLLSDVEGGATSTTTTTSAATTTAPSGSPSGSTGCNINLELKQAPSVLTKDTGTGPRGGNKKPNITMELREKNKKKN